MKRFVALAVAVLASTAVAGCSLEESICRSGEYPAKVVGATDGRTCVPDGQDPPSGYVRYPEGKVPEHVDDEWDVYWRDKAIDESGDLIPS